LWSDEALGRSQGLMGTRFEPSGTLQGELRPPPDKSISHRAALIGAMADGSTRISGFLDSADTRATLAAASAVGAVVNEGDADGHGGVFLEVQGVGLGGADPAAIDVGNAGTLLRIMPGWLAGQGRGEWTLDGDESIRRRPVDRIAEPLAAMGAEVECAEGGVPPLVVRGSELRGIDYELPIASAQVKSCVLFAGLLADGDTTVREPQPSRDHTERMLAAAGAAIRREDGAVIVSPSERLEAGDVAVPGDFSSAAFFIAAALIVPGSDVDLRELGINHSRIGLLSILARMGVGMGGAHEGERAMIIHEIREPGPEPMASLRVRSAGLVGAEVGPEDVPGAIDELPLVALLGCFAEGETVVSGAAELRRKESDRIEAVVDGLGGLGAEIEGRPDGFAVTGTGGLRGGTIDARGDHRMAMLGAIAGLASREGVEVEGFEAVSVSYPRFPEDLKTLVPDITG
jgi:3-phosphoshikimate 1-carboxyvinyltransferase